MPLRTLGNARDDGLRLYFNQAAKLPDPKKQLLGSGKQARFIQVDSASQLSKPDVAAFIAAVIDQSTIPLPSKGKGTLIIKSDGSKKSSRGNSKK